MFKTLSASALIVAMASASFAGAVSDPIIETPAEVFVPAPSSGIGLPVLLGAVAAVAVIAAVANDDEESTPDHPVD